MSSKTVYKQFTRRFNIPQPRRPDSGKKFIKSDVQMKDIDSNMSEDGDDIIRVKL
jgi:hypothetical protein